MIDQWLAALTILLSETMLTVSSFVPQLVGALVVLLVGAAVARVLKRVVISLLETARVSALAKNTPVEHFLKNAEVTQRLEDILGTVVYWLVMLVVLQTTVAILGLASLSELLDRILRYLPNVIAAVLILFFGVLIAGVIESSVKGSIRSIDGRSARFIGKVSSYLVLIITVMAAISELQIAQEFIMVLFVGFVSAASLAFGLAFGLGGKKVVESMLQEWYSRTTRDKDE